jgi:hypothetical protein
VVAATAATSAPVTGSSPTATATAPNPAPANAQATTSTTDVVTTTATARAAATTARAPAAIATHVPRAAAPKGPPVVSEPARPVSDVVTEEAALLRAAQAALSRGDGAGAMARLDEHASRFPGGALTEERQALRAHALCALGRAADARAAASAFVAQSPRSPLAAQVRRSCATHD